MNIDMSLYDATLIPAIMFLLWLLSKYGIPKKMIPLAALPLGIIASLMLIDYSPRGVVIGILLAANAVGFYSGTKNVAGALRHSEAESHTDSSDT
ncbi:hypothetical protein DUZ99_17445 [Xylanibacillus composti]|uniref:Holin n=1 Tax=Xylanibacillus composti TaxID=1572762 RepID=A0A8J4H7K6_9BACL|nr:hypothetical protein [Xylanibacillus composti]MDT9726765.1 hypothetical protein [Xylanibacillus composti]GIQ71471.1 hypothetical protein XYCOK13_42950 [Xylanibacillus composti]